MFDICALITETQVFNCTGKEVVILKVRQRNNGSISALEVEAMKVLEIMHPFFNLAISFVV